MYRPRPSLGAAPEADDLTLVRRSREGDRQAFEDLVVRYQRKAYALALGMVKDKDEAMDIAQEAFVKVYKYLDHFKGDASFYTWLYRIVTNLCIDSVRRTRAAGGEHVELDEALKSEPEQREGLLGTGLGSNPQKAALRRELLEKIEGALGQVPEQHRAILLLREVEGLSYEELARVLKIPKGTVMSRLFHARKKMQALLADYIEGPVAAAAGLGEE